MTYIENLKGSVEDATVEQLREALDTSLHTYQTCGGHWLAHRNENAAKVAAHTLIKRGETVEPDRYGNLVRWGIL